MTYDEIMRILAVIEQLLNDYTVGQYKQPEAAEALVTLHNVYCTECAYDDHIYHNDADGLEMLLPYAHESYSPIAPWLTIDAYGHLASCYGSQLIGNFIFPADIASWLADCDRDEQEELLGELQALAQAYRQAKMA